MKLSDILKMKAKDKGCGIPYVRSEQHLHSSEDFFSEISVKENTPGPEEILGKKEDISTKSEEEVKSSETQLVDNSVWNANSKTKPSLKYNNLQYKMWCRLVQKTKTRTEKKEEKVEEENADDEYIAKGDVYYNFNMNLIPTLGKKKKKRKIIKS